MSLKNILLPCCLYLAFLFTLLAIPPSESQATGQQQYVRFFSQRNCSNNSFLGQVQGTTVLTPTLQNASSVFINGMWRIEYRSNNNTELRNSDGTCHPSILTGTNSTYSKVTRFGNDNQNAVELFLYTSINFNGTPYSVGRNGLNLSNPAGINSWYFTGNNEWMLYSGRNYTGSSFCLKPDSRVVSRGYGFTYSFNNLRTVGSVLFTCNGTGIVTTTTRVTSPTTTTRVTNLTTTTRFSNPTTTRPSNLSTTTSKPSDAVCTFQQSGLILLSLMTLISY